MKKLFLSILAILIIFVLFSCSSKTESVQSDLKDDNVNSVEETNVDQDAVKDNQKEIALLVTYLGTIDDKSFNQGAWEGIKKYADENGVTCKYYQPTEAVKNSYMATIDLAIEDGAKIIVCPGYHFEEPVYMAQDKYPDVKFILLDGEPHDADGVNLKTSDNTMPILYEEDEAGFLAGYAAVKDGNTKLGFMGGMAVPSVIRFGFGYVQGIDAAARELGIDCSVVYNYTGQFAATPEVQTNAASWFSSGTEVVFGCGGAVGNSVMSAAENKNQSENSFVAKVIGVDVDQYYESDTVITSAIKLIDKSVYDAISYYYQNDFQGGKITMYDVQNNGVGIAMENAKFNKFNMDDYNEVYEKLKSKEYEINNNTEDYNPKTALSLTNTEITFID